MVETGRIEYAPDYKSVHQALDIARGDGFYDFEVRVVEKAEQELAALVDKCDRYRAALERCLAGIENFHATGTRQPTWDFRELSRAREVARAALEGEA